LDYYLINKDEPEAYLLIGTDNGFGVFWADQGLQAITSVLNSTPEKVDKMQIKTDSNQSLTITQFIEKIEKLKIRVK
jgi:hypothetical protein